MRIMINTLVIILVMAMGVCVFAGEENDLPALPREKKELAQHLMRYGNTQGWTDSQIKELIKYLSPAERKYMNKLYDGGVHEVSAPEDITETKSKEITGFDIKSLSKKKVEKKVKSVITSIGDMKTKNLFNMKDKRVLVAYALGLVALVVIIKLFRH